MELTKAVAARFTRPGGSTSASVVLHSSPSPSPAVSAPSAYRSAFLQERHHHLRCAGAVSGRILARSSAAQNIWAEAERENVLRTGHAQVDTRSQGFRFDLSQASREGFNTELFQKQAEELRQAVVSGDFEVKPTPYTPVDGTEAIQFYVICAMLFLAFWVGNYLAPNLIFKDTVFSKESGEDHSPGESEQIAESQLQQGPGTVQSADLVGNGMKGLDGSTEKVVVGFGKSSEQTLRKPRRS